MAATICRMRAKPIRSPQANKPSRADKQPALSARDSMALSLALDESLPNEATQNKILGRVLVAIQTDTERFGADSLLSPKKTSL
jgi:hypothetical protein